MHFFCRAPTARLRGTSRLCTSDLDKYGAPRTPPHDLFTLEKESSVVTLQLNSALGRDRFRGFCFFRLRAVRLSAASDADAWLRNRAGLPTDSAADCADVRTSAGLPTDSAADCADVRTSGGQPLPPRHPGAAAVLRDTVRGSASTGLGGDVSRAVRRAVLPQSTDADGGSPSESEPTGSARAGSARAGSARAGSPRAGSPRAGRAATWAFASASARSSAGSRRILLSTRRDGVGLR